MTKIGIIGAGIGGCSLAHYIRKFASNAELVVYEGSSDEHIGGRLKSNSLGDSLTECGGSVYLEDNKYMADFVTELGLHSINLKQDDKEQDSRFGFLGTYQKPMVFDVFTGPSFLVKFRLLYHYGWDLFRTMRYTKQIVEHFKNIYSLQERGAAFTSTANLLAALAPENLFLEMTKVSYEQWLQDQLRVNQLLQQEMAFGLVSNNYTQKLDVHAFVGFITMATMLPRIRAVKEGNCRVPQLLLERALRANHEASHRKAQFDRVEAVERGSGSNKWKLRLASGVCEEFDIVVIAAPLHQASELQGPIDLDTWPVTKQYREMQVTQVAGKLNEQSLHLPVGCASRVGVNVLNSQNGYDPTKGGISDILSVVQKSYKMFQPPLEKSTKVYSFFTETSRIANPVKDVPGKYFSRADHVSFQNWLAYPIYKPLTAPETELGQFQLAPGLYYANAIENAASCMEMAIIGARNVANLIKLYMDQESTITSIMLNPQYSNAGKKK